MQHDERQQHPIYHVRRERRAHTVLAPQRNRLSRNQLDHLHSIAATYAPDIHDAAAVEVLLVLLEVCNILDLSPSKRNFIFGRRMMQTLLTWGDSLPPMRRPAAIRRAWVWLSNCAHPRLYPIDDEGRIQLDGVQRRREEPQAAGRPR